MDCPACFQPNNDSARFCEKCGALLPVNNPENDPLINTIVGGRFRITSVLGEGGMGRVYNAEQQMGTSIRKVAVKTLLAQFAKDPQVLARFNRECGTVSELEHPNTIKVYDFGQTNTGELYIAMELLSGKSLESALETERSLSPERVDRIIGQVCGSLQEAHDKGIVHRDLKPANIFLTTRAGEEDYVKVLDFGIAKRSETGDSKEQKLTQQGTVLGTPPYMSPEQFTGQPLDQRSDIYSLAVVVYEMLTGRLPFDADTPWAWASQHMTAQPFPFEISPAGANVPAKMRQAIMRALSKDKQQRHGSVREFYEDLTLGAVRASILGAVPRMSGEAYAPAAGSGTAAMPARGGATQLGEPVFVTGAQAAAPAGRTIVDSGSVPVIMPHASASTASGQAFPAPAPAAPKKSNAGPIIGVTAVVGVAGIVGAVIALKPSASPETQAPIVLSSAAPTTVAADPPPKAGPGTDPSATTGTTVPKGTDTGSKTSSTGNTGTTTKTPADSGADQKAAAACDAAIGLATGTNTMMAISKFRECSGPKRSQALSAIDSSSAREVKAKGCSAAPAAKAAASIGASSGRNALPAKCK